MKFLRRITLFSFIGLLLSFALWWVSFWNFDYCLKSPYRISLNHGSVSWSDWSAYEQNRTWPAGLRKIGFNGLNTLWKPYVFRRSGNLVVTTLPIWTAVVVFGILYYGVSLVGVGVGLRRQHLGRCRECGRRLADTRLCCRACQTPVSMMTVGGRALGQLALHSFVITVGATVVSYFHFSATPMVGTSIGLTKGALSYSWGSTASPGMSLAGHTDMKTVWLPGRKSSITNAAPVPVMPTNPAPTRAAPSSARQSLAFGNPTAEEFRELLSQYSLPSSPTIQPPPLSAEIISPDSAYSLGLYDLQSIKPDRPKTKPQPDPDSRSEITPEIFEQMLKNTTFRRPQSPAPPAALPAVVVPARTFLFPLWVPLLVFGYATWRLRFAPASLLRRRKKLGLCLKCGYDLRASKERCPECGAPFDEKQLNKMEPSAGVEGALSGVRIDSGVSEK